MLLADIPVELKAVCECGRKATMNLRVDEEGKAVAAGAQTEIGGNDRYIALCRKHFFERLREGEREMPGDEGAFRSCFCSARRTTCPSR